MKNPVRLLILTIVALWLQLPNNLLFCQSNKSIPGRGFTSIKPAETWEEGLISGNGTIGANMMSRPLDETIVFTHAGLFLPQGNPFKPLDNGDRLFEIRRLMDRGLYKQATELAFKFSGQDSLIMPDSFVPAFDMNIKMVGDDEVKNYIRAVDFQTGETIVKWTGSKGKYERRLFVSRADGIVVMKITGSAPGNLNCELKLVSTIPSEKLNKGQVALSKKVFDRLISDVSISADKQFLKYSNKFTKAFPGSIHGVEGMAYVNVINGKSSTTGENMIVKDADEVIVFLDVRPKQDYFLSNFNEMQQHLTKLPLEYNSLLKRHVALHGALFNRVKLDLGGSSDYQLPVEKLFELSTDEKLNKALIEKEFDAGRYNIISSTGELPPTLQGIWGGTFAPWWTGDFTHNGNLPSAIGSNLMGNMPELMLGYTSYLESLIPYLEINARNILGCRGIMLPSHTTSHGFNTLINNNFAGGFWVAGAPWAARFFYDYYLYTGDHEFLVKHAVPFMEKCALFFEDFLYQGSDGKYIFSPSQSPENVPSNTNSQGTFNATMDVAVTKELFTNLIAASKELNINTDKIIVWERMLSKMPDYMISKEGVIKEWLTPRLEETINHRHASQLYALFFGMTEEIEKNKELQEACKKLIELKLEWRSKDTGIGGGNMGFGVVQLGQAATSLGDAKLAYQCLKPLVNKYWLNNLASTHNFKYKFNMDLSGGMPLVIMKMLVESEPGRIKLLPALPEEWPKGKIEGILCRGQVEINSLSWDKKHIEVSFASKKAQTVLLQLPENIDKISIKKGNGILMGNGRPDQTKFTLSVNEEVILFIDML